jgi:mRNA-degrading endonuclease RelE of RelBE toxin-antitoxin system
MDKIQKTLNKIGSKQAGRIIVVFTKIKSNNFDGLDIKKLKGFKYLFRVKAGEYRVVYQKTPEKIEVVGLYKRDDNTYRKY